MSWSRRSFTASFGFFRGGRPRLMILSPWRISARSSISLVSSGASSYSAFVMRWASTLAKSLLIDRFLAVIALSHRDDMPVFVTRRPNNHYHSIRKKSDRLEARLAIVPSRVLYGNGRAGKDDQCISKIQTSLSESSLTFCRIERDLHIIKCTPS